MLDAEYKKFILANQRHSYSISPKALKNIYAANLPVLEKLILEAENCKMLPKQRKRFNMLKLDMVQLYRILKTMDLLTPEGENSKFNITEKALADLTA